jgi:nitric oxide reductase NorQ protein
MILSLSSSAQLARILLGRGLYVPAAKSDMIAAVQALGLTDDQILAESYTDPVDPPVLILPALTPDAAPARIEQGQIDTLFKRLHREVADQFSAFRAVTSPEVVAQIAATLPPGAATAGSIFGVETCQYPGVDFSGLVVSVWNDPAAPVVVSDYVFSPENLHQALIAMDDPLPDNVWLAGERGTGKTEFVSQIAARLGRKLFKVNFDEAIERADFIGGNSITDGSVVWQPGIITQAIQHPGAIVLLDEVGFARAQSIAVLHSLCERSPHRAVTVNETGARIPVLPHVVFFAADNSNGHGNSSGNFAGVREQNSAFLDRFGFTLRFDYLPFNSELDLVVRRSGCEKQVAHSICSFAQVARKKASEGVLTQPPSLRQLIAWARSTAKGVPFKQGFINAVVNKYPVDCELELVGALTTIIGEA